jgi:hypothetical protein
VLEVAGTGFVLGNLLDVGLGLHGLLLCGQRRDADRLDNRYRCRGLILTAASDQEGRQSGGSNGKEQFAHWSLQIKRFSIYTVEITVTKNRLEIQLKTSIAYINTKVNTNNQKSHMNMAFFAISYRFSF